MATITKIGKKFTSVCRICDDIVDILLSLGADKAIEMAIPNGTPSVVDRYNPEDNESED